MEFPKLFLIVFRDEFVVWVVGPGVLEGEPGHDESEENDAEGKDVGFEGVVLLEGLEIKAVNLGGHIGFFGSLEGVAEGLSVMVGGVGKTKISQFNLNFRLRLGNENIFQFQISMNEIVTVEVTERLGDLNKEGSKLGEGGFDDPNEVQETSMLGIFHHQNIAAVGELFILTCTLQTDVLLVF